jgi:hypothetical protein
VDPVKDSIRHLGLRCGIHRRLTNPVCVLGETLELRSDQGTGERPFVVDTQGVIVAEGTKMLR